VKTVFVLAAVLAAIQPVAATAQTANTASVAGKSAEPYAGEVKRINRDSGRVTLKHGPLTGFGMPAMTMAFAVKEPQQLAGLKEGDKVRFALEQSGENLIVTRIVPVR
jgi:Cu/Ag efflux protein CusF